MSVASRPLGRHVAARQKPGVSAGFPPFRVPVGVLALCAAVGVLAVAAAYTEGRLGHSYGQWMNRLYWLGQAMILLPIVGRLFSKGLRAGQTVALLVVLTVAEYLVKVCYSPAAFTFPDELEHWRTTVDILQTGKLFSVNYALPISPEYPGLEELTAALSSITGMSVYVSGLIVAGAAHLLFVCLLYLIFSKLQIPNRIAGLGVAFYVSNSHFQYFDSIFSYQTLALAFLALAVFATWQVTSQEDPADRRGWLAIATVAVLATVVTHHVTSYMLTGALLLIALSALALGSRRTAVWSGALAALSAAAVVGWVMLAAPGTTAYLQPVVSDVLQGFHHLFAGSRSGAPPLSAGPASDTLLSGAATLAVSALLPVGLWHVWRRRRREPWSVALAVGSLAWYAIVAIRLVVPDGTEIAGRASTFVFIPVGFVASLAVMDLLVRARRRTVIALTASALVALLIFDGLVNGWPPYWERLPGPYEVAAFERSVEPEEIDAATWALKTLGPGNRFATDFGSYPVLGAYGMQNAIRDDSALYLSPGFSPAAAMLVQAQSIRYVLVDLRLTKQLPASGQYFPVDPHAGEYTRPLPRADLTKFNKMPGVSRIYDSGDIVIYDLRGSYYAP